MRQKTTNVALCVFEKCEILSNYSFKYSHKTLTSFKIGKVSLSNLSKILSEIIKLVFYQFIQLSFDHNIYWVRFYTKEKIYSLCDK